MSNQSYHYSDLPKKIGLVRPVQQKIKLPSPICFTHLLVFISTKLNVLMTIKHTIKTILW